MTVPWNSTVAPVLWPVPCTAMPPSTASSSSVSISVPSDSVPIVASSSLSSRASNIALLITSWIPVPGLTTEACSGMTGSVPARASVATSAGVVSMAKSRSITGSSSTTL